MDAMTFSRELIDRNKEILNLDPIQDEIPRIGQALVSLNEVINELKEFLSATQFRSEAEEIAFFKETKPSLVSQYLFYRNVLATRVYDAFKDINSRKKSYEEKLLKAESFIERNKRFYSYCLMKKTDLDQIYFLRSRYSKPGFEVDRQFSTNCDLKLSKILANEKIREFLIQMIRRTEAKVSIDEAQLAWTASKTDLIELIYALHSAAVFNNGTANIKAIAHIFEIQFNVQLGDYYRTFQDLRIRKKSQAAFIETLKASFLKRINEV